MEIIKEIKHGEHVINIIVDTEPTSSREWCNLGVMLTQHKRYKLGDIQYPITNAESWEEWFAMYVLDNLNTGLSTPNYDENGTLNKVESKRVERWMLKNLIINPLYLYEHSGLSVSNIRICRFDSSRIGFHFIEKSKLLAEQGKKRMSQSLLTLSQNILDSELQYYNEYLSGNVYGYSITKGTEELSTCFGFYGSDHKASGLIEQAISEIQ